MNESDLKLFNPPIVEAVLDMECDLPPGQQFEMLESQARERYRNIYPKFRTQYTREIKFETKQNEKPKHPVRHGVQAFQFLQQDEKQLVQVRVQGFSFNRLAPYTTLDDYLPEIERTWRLYIALARPIQVRLIRLRYINRILLPLHEGRVQLDDFLKVGPRLPDEEKLTLIGFLSQNQAVEIATGHQANIVLTAQAPEDGKLPIIFDNMVIASDSGEPEDWSWILSSIVALRSLKNYIFRNILTETCLNLYRQP
jgi:uncharacterized protein (TIGR04255 family)